MSESDNEAERASVRRKRRRARHRKRDASPREVAPPQRDLRLNVPDTDPPFDPPDEGDIFGPPELFDDDDLLCETSQPAPLLAEAGDAPFDPPDEDEFDTHLRAPEIEITPEEHDLEAPSARDAPDERVPPAARRLPPIQVFASWDRPEAGRLMLQALRDPRLARATIEIERGGLDAAAYRFSDRPAPGLLLLDSTLRRPELFAGLQRLAPLVNAGAKIAVLGAVNDISLYRALAQRGVSEYIAPPATPEDVATALCNLFAEEDRSRVIAVYGARGGVGASSIAHNIAWAISESLGATVTLLDLDQHFGSAAAAFHLEHGEGRVRAAVESGSDEEFEALCPTITPNLRVLAGRAAPDAACLNSDDTMTLIAGARRLSGFVVIDLPHEWRPWIRDVLAMADRTVIVAEPDLVSLRNAEALMRRMKTERPADRPALLVLNQVGLPDRPEIPVGEFASAVRAPAAAEFAFAPEHFDLSGFTARTMMEAFPQCKAAEDIVAFATALTGLPREFAGAPPVLELCHPLEVATAPPVPNQPQRDPAPDPITRARLIQEEWREREHGPGKKRGKAALLAAGFGFMAPFAAAAVWGVAQSTDMPPATRPIALAPSAAAASGTVMPAPATPAAPTPPELAAFRTATALLDRSDTSGVEALRALAGSGYAPAQYRLARAYEFGEGVRADLVVARHWTERAALAGHRGAMHDLGVFFARGEGAPMDPALAFRWFRQAAEYGVAASQFNLGRLYEQGRGVNRSSEEALFWFTLAANQGDQDAAAQVAALRSTLTPFQVEAAIARAHAFSPRTPDPVANGDLAEPAAPLP